ncbi:hypothetical protein Forpe1208_v009599 [Fusarium oxysporum f. sp. rapae]|uniref:Peptidase A1 domain-containing protein n=1 Tax=Fusarium oxysporum f. sp. rapae TaxID=485398 RepID=A0A8J5NU01_FUSOX|nr:hypothetical protein Forpe1208_v009599 [Fusarium oxysporum f. sp. rapae]
MTFLIICTVLLAITLQSFVALGTTTAVIPWSDYPPQSMPFTRPPHVHLWFTREETYTGRPDSFTFFVDTGSTGIITRVANLNVLESEPRTPGAYLFQTSSNTLYRGFWINRWVWFNKGTTSESMPDKNVLLNLKSIGGISTTCEAVGTTYSPGWIIDKDGIMRGLTNSNWPPFASRTVSLPAPVPAPVSPRYHWQWGEIPGTYRVASFTPADCSDLGGCSILIDNGIDYTSARSQAKPPDGFPQDSTSHQLSREQSVTVQFGVGRTPVGTETFTVGPPGSPDRSCSFAPQ